VTSSFFSPPSVVYTRLTAMPILVTAVPRGVKRNSGSRVRFPAMTTLFRFISFRFLFQFTKKFHCFVQRVQYRYCCTSLFHPDQFTQLLRPRFHAWSFDLHPECATVKNSDDVHNST